MSNEDDPIYVTTFCNQGHSLRDGQPIEHECYQLSPIKLRVELYFDAACVFFLGGSMKELFPGERQAIRIGRRTGDWSKLDDIYYEMRAKLMKAGRAPFRNEVQR